MDRTLLNNATTTDDSPTPGYMLTEIARATVANYTANTQIQEFLVSRLKKDNHNVKYKCLSIIKHVCRTGRPEFKREMARNIDAVKECLQYRGPPDPLRGDEIYKRVREIAKETLDAIFDSQMPVTTSAVATSNRIQGMGGGDAGPARSTGNGSNGTGSSFFAKLGFSGDNDQEPAYSGHPGATGDFGRPGTGSSGSQDGNSGYYVSPYRTPQAGATTSSSGMVGFGNTDVSNTGSIDNRSLTAKAAYYSAQALSSLAGSSDSSAPIENRSLAAKAAYYSAQSIASVASIANAVVSASGGADKPTDFGYATNRGPNAYNSNTYMPQSGNAVNGFSSNSAIGGAWGNTNSGPQNISQEPGAGLPGSIVPEIPKHSSGIGRAGGAAADGEYERAMIEGLCEPAGLKVVPPEDKLETFLIAAQTLSPDLVGPCLVDLLNSESWQTRTKALIVITSLAKAKGCFAHNMWWVGCADELKAMASDTKSSVRIQAAKCLRALKIADSVASSENVTAGVESVSSPATTSTFSLLDDTDYPNQQPQLQQQPPQQQQSFQQHPVNDMSDMFAGMSVAGTSVSGTSASTVSVPSLLDSFSVTTPSQPIATSGFDFLGSGPVASVSQYPVASPVSYSAPPPVPTNTLSAFDFLDSEPNVVVAPLPPVPVPPGPTPASGFDDLFGSMTVNVTSPLTSNPPTTQQPIQQYQQQSFQQQQFSRQHSSAQSYASDFAGLDASPLGQAMYSAYGNHPRPMANNPGLGYPGGSPASLNLSQPYPQMSAQPRGIPPQPGMYVQQMHIPPAPITSPGGPFGNSMTSVTANRKVIPDAPTGQQGSSGFSFISGGGSQPSGSKGSGDAFSFIQDEVKASTSKR